MAHKFVLQIALALAVGVTFTQAAGAQSPARPAEIAPVPAKVLGARAPVPGTLATNSTPAANPKLLNSFSVRVQPDYLPSWVTNQPLAYERYGVAPAVVTLTFGHKEKAPQN